jgi:integrase
MADELGHQVRPEVDNGWRFYSLIRTQHLFGTKRVLRHTAASAWLSSGISVRAVAEFLGHTEATVQATYSHMMPDDRDRARKAMEKFFARTGGDEGRAASGGRDVR